MVEIVVALLASVAVILSSWITARASLGARKAAQGARRAANAAQLAGETDHDDHSQRLDVIAETLAELVRDVGGLRSENRQNRAELHDLRVYVRSELSDIRGRLLDHLNERRNK